MIVKILRRLNIKSMKIKQIWNKVNNIKIKGTKVQKMIIQVNKNM